MVVAGSLRQDIMCSDAVAAAGVRPFDAGRGLSACGPLFSRLQAPAKLPLESLVSARHHRRNEHRSHTRAARQLPSQPMFTE